VASLLLWSRQADGRAKAAKVAKESGWRNGRGECSGTDPGGDCQLTVAPFAVFARHPKSVDGKESVRLGISARTLNLASAAALPPTLRTVQFSFPENFQMKSWRDEV